MMRWIYLALIPFVLLIAIAGLIYQHKDKATIVKLPPQELAQWYKPENKRQVWLHNMFKLRREMQAVQYYAENKDNKHLQKWTQQLNNHYKKIAEMVPSWGKKLDLNTLNQLDIAASIGDHQEILKSVTKLQESCDSCHSDYQAITALTYRAPDFSKISITPDTNFKRHMQTLTTQVNQIKIAAEDNMPELASKTLVGLQDSMNELGETCVECHKKDRKTYPDQQMQTTLQSLASNLTSGTLKQQSQDLGTLAVLACARCHGTHRLAFGARTLLSQQPSVGELLKH